MPDRMTSQRRSALNKVLTLAGAGFGLFWGGTIALMADRTMSNVLADLIIRLFVVITFVLLGGGIGWLCFRLITALSKKGKGSRP